MQPLHCATWFTMRCRRKATLLPYLQRTEGLGKWLHSDQVRCHYNCWWIVSTVMALDWQISWKLDTNQILVKIITISSPQHPVMTAQLNREQVFKADVFKDLWEKAQLTYLHWMCTITTISLCSFLPSIFHFLNKKAFSIPDHPFPTKSKRGLDLQRSTGSTPCSLFLK